MHLKNNIEYDINGRKLYLLFDVEVQVVWLHVNVQIIEELLVAWFDFWHCQSKKKNLVLNTVLKIFSKWCFKKINGHNSNKMNLVFNVIKYLHFLLILHEAFPCLSEAKSTSSMSKYSPHSSSYSWKTNVSALSISNSFLTVDGNVASTTRTFRRSPYWTRT